MYLLLHRLYQVQRVRGTRGELEIIDRYYNIGIQPPSTRLSTENLHHISTVFEEFKNSILYRAT